MIGPPRRTRPAAPPAERTALDAGAVPPADLRALFKAHYGSIWRLLRRLGIRHAQLDDVAQEVFWVAARKLKDIAPDREHAFLYGVAIRVAANELRRQASPFVLTPLTEETAPADEAPSAENRLVEREARLLLDQALERMPLDLKTVFVLHELEGIEVKEIAAIEAIPVGTASSRLRRAREAFSAIAKRMRASRPADGQASGEEP
jgi:RNA polymerase sigma-70 factor (ECF subfamily)